MANHPSRRAGVRRLLLNVLSSDSDLDAFCGDYFPDTHIRFTNGMDRIGKINVLLERVAPEAIVEKLRHHDAARTVRYEHILNDSQSQQGQHIGPNPYRGLAAFEAEDGHLFFGREELTERLWQQCNALYTSDDQPQLLAILGPSGSGKSSLARAGLLAMLSKRPIPGPRGPVIASVRPGRHPIEALARALQGLSVTHNSHHDIGAQRELIEDLRQPNRRGQFDGLRLYASSFADGASTPLFILIDQFEEMYTLCKDPQERDAFAGLLLDAVSDDAHCVCVVLTLRSDFLGETQRYHPDLNRIIAQQAVVVPALSAEEMQQAIVAPAYLAGYALDEAVVELLLSEARGSDGALPLLEFALTRIWEGLHSGQSPTDTLKAIGGVGGALATRAQEAYDQLSAREQTIARRALVRMVQLGEGAQDSRRRVPIEELVGWGDTEEEVLAVIRRFSSDHARLVTLAAEDGPEIFAEVTHESLFEHWQALRGWIDESRADRRFHDRISGSATLWHESGRLPGRLWRPPDLDLLRDFVSRNGSDLTEGQMAFFKAGDRQIRVEKRNSRLLMCGLLAGLLAIGSIPILAWQWTKRELVSSYIEHGRQYLLNGDSSRALMWLSRAYGSGSRTPVLKFLLAQAAIPARMTRHVLIGHRGSVTAAAFSRDGSRVLTVSSDKTARIWDTVAGRLLVSLDGHAGGVRTGEFSPDGKHVLTGSADQTARLWDAKTGALLLSLTGHAGEVSTAHFSPDGSRVLTSAGLKPEGDKVARVWDRHTGKLLLSLTGHAEGIKSAQFSEDGTQILTASWDNTARLWDAKTGQLLHLMKAKEEITVSSAELDRSGSNVLLTGSRYASIWDAQTGKQRAIIPHSDMLVLAGHFNPSGSGVATIGSDKRVRIFGGVSGFYRAETEAHTQEVGQIAFSPDGTRIITASFDQTAKIWDAQTGVLLSSLVGHNGRVWHAQFSPDGLYVVTTSQDGTARIWDAYPNGPNFALNDGLSEIYKAEFSPDGQSIVTVGSDRVPRVWDANTGSPLSFLIEPKDTLLPAEQRNGVSELRFSPDGKRLFTSGTANKIQIWDVRTGSLVDSIENVRVMTSSLSPDGIWAVLLNEQDRSNARIVNAQTGQLLADLRGHTHPITCVSFSPNGTQLATASEDGGVKLWDGIKGKLLATMDRHEGPVLSVTFSPDGKRLLTACKDKTAKIWDVANGGLLASLDGHREAVSSAAFSPDGALIATTSGDGLVRIWDASKGYLLTSLTGHHLSVYQGKFSFDGARIVTGGMDKVARVWQVGYEVGTAEDVGLLTRCRVPYRFDGESLVPAKLESAGCEGLRPTAKSPRWAAGDSLAIIARLSLQKNDLHSAMSRFREAYHVFQITQDTEKSRKMLWAIGAITRQLGDEITAQKILEQVATQVHDLDSQNKGSLHIARIFRDFGIYSLDELHDATSALFAAERAVKLQPRDVSMLSLRIEALFAAKRYEFILRDAPVVFEALQEQGRRLSICFLAWTSAVNLKRLEDSRYWAKQLSVAYMSSNPSGLTVNETSISMLRALSYQDIRAIVSPEIPLLLMESRTPERIDKLNKLLSMAQ